MKPLKEKISITIDTDVLKAVRSRSELYERSLSQFITIILKDYLADKQEDYDLEEILRGRVHKSDTVTKLKENNIEEDNE